MSKFEKLYKKVELFEKLAVYGNRSSFLKAIAQNGPTSYDGDIADQAKADEAQKRSLLQQAQRLMQGAGADSAAIGNAILPLSGKPADKNAILNDIDNVLRTGKLSPLSNEYKQLQSIRSQLAKVLTAPADPGANEPPMVFTPDPQKDQIKAYPPIDPKQQDALGRFVMTKGLTFVDPKKMSDGKLGPETRKALDAFKKYLAQTEKKNVSDQEALALVQTMAPNAAAV